MTPPVGEASARAIRRERARRLVQRFGLWVGLPTLLSVVYYGCVMTQQYESFAIVSVQQKEHGIADDTQSNSAASDARLIIEYMQSRSMAALLTSRHGFAEHYRSDDVDRFSRLDENAGAGEIYDYYSDKVLVTYHSQSGTIHLRVRAYSAAAAQQFAEHILTAAQERLDHVFSNSKHQRVIVAVSEPSLPSSATYPRRKWRVTTVFFIALVLMGIFGLLTAAVREHAKF